MRVPWNWPKPEPMTANFAAMSDADLLRATIHELREAALEHHWDDYTFDFAHGQITGANQAD